MTNLFFNELKKFQSLHTLTKLPIAIYNANGDCLNSYGSTYRAYEHSSIYNHEKLFSIRSGEFQEIFLTFLLNDHFITIGPMLPKCISTKKINTLSSEQQSYILSIPVLSTDEFRELINLINFLFSLDLESYYLDYLENLLKKQKDLLSHTNFIEKQTIEEHIQTCHCEHYLLSLIAQGEIDMLYHATSKLKTGIFPIPRNDSIRHEKNYCIILLEKISHFTIQMGLDIIKSLDLRDFYIQQIERQDTVINVLNIRNSAILHFTEEMHNISNTYSLFVRRIIQYISAHIYEDISLIDIENYFYISNSQLRRRFKQEVGVSIGIYIKQQKITIAKYLLLKKHPPSHVAKQLNFRDLSYFYKVFKQYTNLTSLQFLKKNNIRS